MPSSHSMQPSDLLTQRSTDSRSPYLSFAPRVESRSSAATALSLNQMTTLRWSLPEDVLGCERAGIKRIGIWRKKLDEFGVERTANLLAETNLTVSSLNWAGGFTGGNGYSFEEAIDDTRTAIYDAAAIGARTLTIVSGPRWSHIASHARRLLMEGLAATVDIAAEHGVTLALQPMDARYAGEWTFLNSLDETLEALSAFEHPFLGLALGTYHLWQEPQLIERMPQIAPYVASVQLSDSRERHGEQLQDRLLPGEGIIPLNEIVAALSQAGYQGDYEFDVWSEALWKTNYDQLLTRCISSTGPLLERAVS